MLLLSVHPTLNTVIVKLGLDNSQYDPLGYQNTETFVKILLTAPFMGRTSSIFAWLWMTLQSGEFHAPLYSDNSLFLMTIDLDVFSTYSTSLKFFEGIYAGCH